MFDFNFKNTGYDKGNAYLLGLCADLAYEDWSRVIHTLKTWGIHNHKVYERNDTEAFLAITDNYAILAFRGTSSLADMLTDAKCSFVQEGTGYSHAGFVGALNPVWAEILADIFTLRVPLWITGHSLGAALATLAISRLNNRGLLCPCYTFGAPRVGDHNFTAGLDSTMLHRYVNNNDIVTNVPLYVAGYRHGGIFHYFCEDSHQEDDISWWGRKKDKWKGLIGDIGEIGLDRLKDHKIGNYILNLKRAIS